MMSPEAAAEVVMNNAKKRIEKRKNFFTNTADAHLYAFEIFSLFLCSILIGFLHTVQATQGPLPSLLVSFERHRVQCISPSILP